MPERYNSLHVSLQDVSPGRTELSLVVTGGGRAFLRDKRIKTLSVSGTRRPPLAPKMPTFEEAGFGSCGASLFFGLAAPPGTHAAVRAQIQGFREAARGREVSARATQQLWL